MDKNDYLINVSQTIHAANRYVDFVYNGMVFQFRANPDGWAYYKKLLRKLDEVSKALEELEEMLGGCASMI